MRYAVAMTPEGSGWVVRTENGADVGHYGLRIHALEAGRRTALQERSELIIRGRDGTITDRERYGEDRFLLAEAR